MSISEFMESSEMVRIASLLSGDDYTRFVSSISLVFDRHPAMDDRWNALARVRSLQLRYRPSPSEWKETCHHFRHTSGDTITFSFTWHMNGIIEAIDLSNRFRHAVIRVYTKEKSRSIPNLDVLLNLFDQEKNRYESLELFLMAEGKTLSVRDDFNLSHVSINRFEIRDAALTPHIASLIRQKTNSCLKGDDGIFI